MSSGSSYPVELVITAPEPPGAFLAYKTRCRTTLGVLSQLLTESKNRVLIGAPFIQPGYGLSDGVLFAAMESALRRGVSVDILSSAISLGHVDRDRLLCGATGNLQLYRPSDTLTVDQRLGSHAKFCVADGTTAYVGSANLTGPGLSSQLELGLLVHGDIAQQIEEFWDYIIEAGIFVPVP